MKNQALFSSKDKSKKLKCLLLQFLFGALRVKRRVSSSKYSSDKAVSLVKMSHISCDRIKTRNWHVPQVITLVSLGFHPV